MEIEELIYQNDLFDFFYLTSSNLILSYILSFQKPNNFELLYRNFYENICQKLFVGKLSKAINIFYNPDNFEAIKNKFGITKKYFDILLFSYRYCLNEINSSNDSIFGRLYEKKNICDKEINNQYFPGNDISPEVTIYEIYSKVKNHFSSEKKIAMKIVVLFAYVIKGVLIFQ